MHEDPPQCSDLPLILECIRNQIFDGPQPIRSLDSTKSSFFGCKISVANTLYSPQLNVWGSVTICGPNSGRMGLRSGCTTPNMDLLCLALQCYKFSRQSRKYSNPTQLEFLSFFSLILQLASFVFIQYMMDLSHLTPEQVTQLQALLLPESPAPASSSTGATTASSPFSPPLPPPIQAPTAPASQQQSVHFLDPGTQTAAAIPRPITQLYQSHQHSASGHPSSGHPSTPSPFQPFLGISNLGVGLAAGHVNQARLASAATTLPRQPTLSCCASRSARTRGPARQPPSIPAELTPGSALHLRSCFVPGTPGPVVWLTVKVYPPAVCFLIICHMQVLI